MKMRVIYWLALPAFAGLMAYLGASGQLRRVWLSIFPVDPVIDYPRKLDLGPHEIREQVIAPFAISNRGASELVIDQIQSNCSCSGMEEPRGGRYDHIESLRLKPGEKANLVMRISVRGVPALGQMVNLVQFHTNDPSQPVGQIEAVVGPVSRGVSTNPGLINFGTVPLGTRIRSVLDVWDTATPPRVIERVTSTKPDRITVRLLPVPHQSQVVPTDPEDGALIGRLEVIVDTTRAAEFNDGIQIHTAGRTREPDKVPLVGRVIAAVELSPALIVLPRASSNGPLYEATCVCRSTNGERLAVSVESPSPGLVVQGEDGDEPTVRVLRIKWDPRQAKIPAGGRRETVRLRTKAGKAEVPLELQVVLER